MESPRFEINPLAFIASALVTEQDDLGRAASWRGGNFHSRMGTEMSTLAKQPCDAAVITPDRTLSAWRLIDTRHRTPAYFTARWLKP